MSDNTRNNDELDDMASEEHTAGAPETAEAEEEEEAVDEVDSRKLSDRYARLMGESGKPRTKLTGLYRDWFLDYASYVILERAVPHIDDGLKPVQRRILHTMRRMDDGRYNKVANVVGETMKYHPHGDASIGDALVQLGQKDLLVDCQGNWGNILTGDGAAAARYIEARLSKFALDVVFNPKTTEWMLSYDGRNNEPVTLPVKFPLLLAQGVEGIAVGLASKVLPHNFNELIDASIAYLKGEDFVLYPDFSTGGLMDVNRYNDGLRGGVIKVRARINKVDKRTLAITEIPFGTTTETIKDSIIKANEKGKIKIKHVDDNTAANVEILVHVSNDESVDKTIDALYAFTLCENSISPNSCVISDDKPHFMGVSQILRHNTDRTKELLGRELQIRLDELAEEWHMASLERIFIENKIYQVIEGCKSREEAYKAVDKGIEPFKKLLRREVVLDDVIKLTELKFIRISRFDSDKADTEIKSIEAEEKQVRHDLDHLVDYTIAYFRRIKEKYGKGRERRTEIREFDSISVAKVAVANSKLYVDRENGFFGIGSSMKGAEYVCDCSDLDDVIVFAEDGRYIITRVTDKAFFAPAIIYAGVFRRGDERTIYNVLYRDGDKGPNMMKRCAIVGVTRDKEYNITKGNPKSRVLYMSVNSNGEAETLKIIFRQRAKLKKSIVDLDFSALAIKGRASQGNIFSRYPIHKILLKAKGASTLAGQNIWYDGDVQRLNDDGRGVLLGEFEGDDKIIVFTANDGYYTTGYDIGHHFPEDTVKVEKYDPEKIYTVAYWDDAQKRYYLKRFAAEISDRLSHFVDEENPKSHSVAMSDDSNPALEIIYGGKSAQRPSDVIDAAEFIAVKSHKAKGKRLSNLEVAKVRFIPSTFGPAPEPDDAEPEPDEKDEQPDFTPVETVAEQPAEVIGAVEPAMQAEAPQTVEVFAQESAKSAPEPAVAPKATSAPKMAESPKTPVPSVSEPVSVPKKKPVPEPDIPETEPRTVEVFTQESAKSAPEPAATSKATPAPKAAESAKSAPEPAAPAKSPATTPKPAAPTEPAVRQDSIEVEIVVPQNEDDTRNPQTQQLNLF